MDRKLSLFTGSIFIILIVLFWSAHGYSKIEWNISNKISLEDTPLDISIAKDGLTTYILCEKKILVYSVREKKVTDTIPLTDRFSQIALSPDGERLLLTNPKKNQVTIIQVTPIHDIGIGQSPVIGNADAPVSIFAFLDFE